MRMLKSKSYFFRFFWTLRDFYLCRICNRHPVLCLWDLWAKGASRELTSSTFRVLESEKRSPPVGLVSSDPFVLSAPLSTDTFFALPCPSIASARYKLSILTFPERSPKPRQLSYKLGFSWASHWKDFLGFLFMRTGQMYKRWFNGCLRRFVSWCRMDSG